ncbi:uncharacterized protein LOC132903178 [Amyelois transitella]|uniref:uncharacterized protein LOC132903178 n=1 Tax=Amyelois transitella TaxID=680683 RepID=UPI0029901D03|nr:uncharacterized protein LOC132903178 [Amyelois transitella]
MRMLLNNSGRFRNNLFVYKCMSSVPIPDLHILNEKCVVKLDFLYPLRKPAPPPPSNERQCSLAGQPKEVPTAFSNLRNDILDKWNQKPEKDKYKEMVKHTFTY